MSTSGMQDKRENKLLGIKDILFIWQMILENIALLIILPFLAYAIGYIYTHRLENKYGAKVELLLKSNETYDYQDPIYQGLGAYGMYMDVQNQIRILQSRDLIGEVVDRVGANTSYFVVGRLKKAEVFETLPFQCESNVFNETIYERPLSIKILDKDNYELVYNLNDETQTFYGVFNEKLYTEDFEIVLNRSYTFGPNNIDVIKSSDYEVVLHSEDYLISKYQASLSIENIEYTSILEVSVIDELAQRGKVFLDTLSSVYIDVSKRIQLEVNQNTLDNIQKQIDTLVVFIQQKESELLSYKDNNSILNPEKEEGQYFEEYVRLTKEEREILKSKNSLISLKEYLLDSKNEHFLPPNFYIEENDDYLNLAVEELRTKQLKYEISLTISTSDNFEMRQRKNQISSLKGDILKYIDNVIKAYDKELNELGGYIGEYRGMIQELPKSAQGISNIQRELDVNNKMYLFLLEKKTNTLIARAGIIPQVRVIEKTTSLGVVSPDKTRIKRLFILGGFIVALLFATVRKLFFERVETVSKLAETTNLTVVGGVPRMKDQNASDFIMKNPKSQLTESFRSIRTNLSFLSSQNGEKGKLILLSSFFPGEGKTFCSANLSQLISMTDKKILLIDFDLHKPKVHKTFGLDNTEGISSYIVGKSKLEDIIHKDVKPNLDLILAGPIAPNPSELVLRKEVDNILNEVKELYDFVIIDTAPFGILNDTLELVKKVDVFLIVLNTKYTKSRGIRHIEDLFGKYDDVNIGLILNSIKERRIRYYYTKYASKYTYGYNYSYGYGYGDYSETNED
ncbi:MAG: polysaccharide biosynthesis tyrosine autokinase [Crocinitomicaceae bacterium]